MKAAGKGPIVFSFSFLCLLVIAGCGSNSTPTAPSQDELGAYLSANPDVANEDAPDVDSE